LYNIAQQIFLFKLELCPEIKSVFVNHLVPRMIAGPVDEEVEADAPLARIADRLDPDADLRNPEDDICFRNESRKETDKAEGFADDTTGLTIFELESLAALK
jgi:hypothetical protein